MLKEYSTCIKNANRLPQLDYLQIVAGFVDVVELTVRTLPQIMNNSALEVVLDVAGGDVGRGKLQVIVVFAEDEQYLFPGLIGKGVDLVGVSLLNGLGLLKVFHHPVHLTSNLIWLPIYHHPLVCIVARLLLPH